MVVTEENKNENKGKSMGEEFRSNKLFEGVISISCSPHIT